MAVHELVYRRLEGPRRAPELPALAIARSDLRVLRKRKSIRGALTALGIFTLLTTGYVVLRAGVLDLYLPAGMNLAQAPAVNARFFARLFGTGFHQLLVVMLALFAGAGRVAEDLRTNALSIYLSKPLSRSDYLAGKIGATASIVALGALGAPLLCYLVAALVDPKFLAGNLRAGAAVVIAGVVSTAYHTSAVLFFSALVRSGRIAGLLFGCLYFLSDTLQGAASLALRTDQTSVLGYSANLETLGRHLYGVDPARAPLLPSLLAITLVIVGGLLFARARVRAVEVVR